jgi:crossover junction endodeoxyribonuclease RuvC
MKTIIGIDPGATGAIAYIYEDGGVDIEDCPTINGQPDQYSLAALLRDRDIKQAFIEQVSAMPGQGVTSMFHFGENFGTWIGAIGAFKIPLIRVTPQKWKKEFGLIGQEKDIARRRAIELFPSMAPNLSRKKDGGRADALLIAEYGRRFLK